MEQSPRDSVLSPPQLLNQHTSTPLEASRSQGAPVLLPLCGANPPFPAFAPALWTFLWFVGFCFLTNQWAATKVNDVLVGADSARAAITFSFFSIFSWGLLAFLAYQRYKAGVDEFIQNYVDPTPDPSTAYASYPGMPADTYQQPPFTQNAESTEGYQPPPVY